MAYNLGLIEGRKSTNETPKTTTPTNTTPRYSKSSFIEKVTPYAEKASAMLGGTVPTSAIVAQWALESGD